MRWLLAGVLILIVFSVILFHQGDRPTLPGSHPQGAAPATSPPPTSAPPTLASDMSRSDVAAAGAPTDAAAPRTPAERTGLLVGSVIDAAGAPVADAIVTAYAGRPWFNANQVVRARGPDPAAAPVRSDAEGGFRIAALPATDNVRYLVHIVAPGFAQEVRGEYPVWAGQTSGTGPIALDVETTLHGRVVDDTERPIAGAQLVATWNNGTASATADARGAFVIGTLEAHADSVVLSVTADGFVALAPGASRVALEQSRGPEGLVVRLSRAGAINGLVIDVRGEPLAGVEVSARHPDDETLGQLTLRRTRSAADGSFAVTGVAHDRPVELSASLPGYWLRPTQAATADATDVRLVLERLPRILVRVFDADTGAPIDEVQGEAVSTEQKRSRPLPCVPPASPGAPLGIPCATAGRYDIYLSARGHERGALEGVVADGINDAGPFDVHLPSLERGGLFGKVVRERDQTPIAGATLRLLVARKQPMRIHGVWVAGEQVGGGTAKTDADGRFHFTDLGQENQLEASAPGFCRTTLDPRTTITSADAPLVIALRDGASIHGRVLDVDGNGASDQPVLAIRADGGFLLTRSRAAGRFEFDSLDPGDWRLSVGNVYSAARTSATDAPPIGAEWHRAVLVAAGDRLEVDLDLRTLGAALRGRLLIDGEPQQSHRVLLASDADLPLPQVEQVAWTGADGDFAFVCCNPGRHEVVATPSSSYEEMARQTVSLAIGRVAEVRLDLHTGSIEGSVLDRAGRPLQGTIRCPFGRGTRIGADGRFKVTGVLPGEVTVRVDLGPLAQHERVITVIPGGAAQADFVLDAPGAIALRVTAADHPEPPRIVFLKLIGDEARTASDMALLDEHGAAELSGISPGHYAVEARSPDDMQIGTATVEVVSGATVTLSITLSPKQP